MRPLRKLSEPARRVLAAMLDAGSGWSYGYELCQKTGVKSGTLYPLLVRLRDYGFLEAQWQEATQHGRPPRHAYRLTKSGKALVRDNPPAKAPASARSRKAFT